MSFKETCPVEERIALFREYETGVFTVSDLCRRHGISRETAAGIIGMEATHGHRPAENRRVRALEALGYTYRGGEWLAPAALAPPLLTAEATPCIVR